MDHTLPSLDYSSPDELLESARDVYKAANRAQSNGDTDTYNILLPKVEQAYNELLNREFKDGFVLVLYGVVEQRKGNHGKAIALLTVAEAKLLKWLSEWPEGKGILYEWLRDAHATMAYCHKVEGRRDIAIAHFKQALEYNPNDANVLSNFASLFINDGTPEKAIELINKVRKLAPDDTHDDWNLGLAHLELGHWKEGFKLYHQGVLHKQRLNLNYWRRGRTPIWDGNLDQTVVVYGEQGVGDEIMFASILPEFIRECKHVIFDCHPRLEKTFKRSFPDIEIFGTRKTNDLDWAAERDDIDACLPIGSLGMFYRRKNEDFKKAAEGYLKADPERVEFYRQKLAETGPGPYIGLTWEGGTKKTRFDLRSIGLRHLAPIRSLPATFISLQYTPEAWKAAEKYGLPHWQGAIDDLDEMHALIMACDAVVTVNQSVFHQAGGLGQKTFCLTPARPAWRYGLKGSKSVWYPSVTQYRQRMEEEPSWEPAIGRLAEDLKIFIKKRSQNEQSGNSRPRHEHDRSGEGRAH